VKIFLKKYRVRIRNTTLGLVVSGLLLITFFVIYGYFINFEGNFFPTERDKLGQFGDYFGGALNPIFGLASFLALLVTIIYQAKELKLSRTELELSRVELSNSAIALTNQNRAIELQSFEQTFFSWLANYQSLVNSIEGETRQGMIGDSNIIIKNGKVQLYAWWKRQLSERELFGLINIESRERNLIPQKSIMEIYRSAPQGADDKHYLPAIAALHSEVITNFILSEWMKLYKSQEYQFDSMFRTLYLLLVWINSQQPHRLNDAQKWLYVTIIRSQFSWIEMVYLFYNGFTNAGRNFRPLIEKYALFDNLTFDSDAGINAMKKFVAPQKNYSIYAFNSELAREKMGLPKSSEETLALATTTSHSS